MGLNALLPPDVAVLRSAVAPEGFDARRDATSRTYRYRVLQRRERSAFLAGRALWTNTLEADDPTELLRTQSVARLQELIAIVDRYAA